MTSVYRRACCACMFPIEETQRSVIRNSNRPLSNSLSIEDYVYGRRFLCSVSPPARCCSVHRFFLSLCYCDCSRRGVPRECSGTRLADRSFSLFVQGQARQFRSPCGKGVRASLGSTCRPPRRIFVRRRRLKETERLEKVVWSSLVLSFFTISDTWRVRTCNAPVTLSS